MSRDRFRRPSEYDDTFEGLLPSIGAQAIPGLEERAGELPEDIDYDAFGSTPGAEALSDAQMERQERRSRPGGRQRGRVYEPTEAEAAATAAAERQALIDRALAGLEGGARIISDDVEERRGKRNKDRFHREAEEEGRERHRVAATQARHAGTGLGPLMAPGGIDPMVQPERGLHRQMGVRPRSDIALEEFASNPGAASAMAMGELLPVNRVASGAANVAAGGTYAGAQGDIDRIEAESPWASAFGALTSFLPAAAAAPLVGDMALARMGGAGGEAAAGAVARGLHPLTRVGGAMIEALGGSAMNQAARGESSAESALLSGGITGLVGAGPAAVMRLAEGVQRPAQRLARSAQEGLESYAQGQRVRGSFGDGVAAQRAANAVEGGIPEVARWLHETGANPRGSVRSIDDSREIVSQVQGRSGRRIGDVMEQMGEVDAADTARWNTERAARGDREADRFAALEAIENADQGELLMTSEPGAPSHQIGRDIFEARLDRDRRALDYDVRAHLGVPELGGEPIPARSIASELEPDVDPAAATMAADAADIDTFGRAVNARNGWFQRRMRAERAAARANGERSPERALRAFRNDEVTGIEQPGWAHSMLADVPVRSLPRGIDPEDASRLRGRVDELMPALPEPQVPGSVDLDPVIRALGSIEQGHTTPIGAVTPGRQQNVAGARAMADDYRSTGGRLPFGRPAHADGTATGAQDALSALDEDINYRPETGGQRRFPAADDRELRTARRALRGSMNDAVTRSLGPEVGAEFPGLLRDYQLSTLADGFGDQHAMRAAGNRQASLTDYLSVNQNAPLWERAARAAQNRIFRGREATLMATGAEGLSDAMSAAHRGSGNARRAIGASGRMGLAAELSRPEALEQPVSAADLGFEEPTPEEIEALPLISDEDARYIPEMTDEEASELDELPWPSEDEINALPIVEDVP
jgi:hypothetical protein